MPRKIVFRRKRRKQSRRVTSNLSKKLNKLTKFVYKTIETKYADDRFNPLVLNNTGWVRWSLTDIQAGTGATNDERVGDKVTLTSLQTKIAFDKIQGDDFIRVLVLQFNDVDDPVANLVIPQVLEYGNIANNNANGNSMDQIMSPYKAGGTYKFKVLYDKVLHPMNRKQISVSEQVGEINAQRMLTISSKDLKPHNKILGFQPGQNQQRPITNGIYLYMYSTSSRLLSTDGATQAFVINRMKYRDA